jgi:hypothetical protein
MLAACNPELRSCGYYGDSERSPDEAPWGALRAARGGDIWVFPAVPHIAALMRATVVFAHLELRSVRRETGKEQVVEVRCDEGGAIHIGPEPCVRVRENMGEASAGERIGQPLGRERIQTRMPTSFTERKVSRMAHAIANAQSGFGL